MESKHKVVNQFIENYDIKLDTKDILLLELFYETIKDKYEDRFFDDKGIK